MKSTKFWMLDLYSQSFVNLLMIGSLAVTYETKLANDHLSQSRIKEPNNTIYYITNFFHFIECKHGNSSKKGNQYMYYVYNQMAYQVQ